MNQNNYVEHPNWLLEYTIFTTAHYA